MSKSIKDVIKNEPVYDASMARRDLENAVGYGCKSSCSDETPYFIQAILIQEIKRLRQDHAHLRWLVENFLTALDEEKA